MNDKNDGHPKGSLIAFEGIDGCGKSTQITKIADKLRENNIRCYQTREPTDGPVGSLIRQILSGRTAADGRVTAALFTADRLDHLLNGSTGICAKINGGINVITDRYYFSSYAYQSADIDMDWIVHANSVCAALLRPALTVFLDVPVERALFRIGQGRFDKELFETEERLIKVREGYFRAFDILKDTEKTAFVDADAEPDIVTERIWDIVSGILNK